MIEVNFYVGIFLPPLLYRLRALPDDFDMLWISHGPTP